jgi:hypothetical protein
MVTGVALAREFMPNLQAGSRWRGGGIERVHVSSQRGAITTSEVQERRSPRKERIVVWRGPLFFAGSDWVTHANFLPITKNDLLETSTAA